MTSAPGDRWVCPPLAELGALGTAVRRRSIASTGGAVATGPATARDLSRFHAFTCGVTGAWHPDSRHTTITFRCIWARN